MTTIRPNFPPPGGQLQPQTQGKLDAQREFFAALRQAGAPTAAAASAPAPPAPTVQAPATSVAAPAEAPQKVLRPGSLIDIRV